MKSEFRIFLAAVVGFLIVPFSTFAHHGSSAYDKKSPVTLKGIVTNFFWVNPHTQIYFDVKDDNGNVIRWSCEAPNPGRMVRAGWMKDSVKEGDRVTATVWPAKKGVPVGFLVKLVLPDGKTLSTGVEEVPE
jgi:hypothetical protein